MLRAVLELVLMLIIAQSVRRVLGGLMDGLRGAQPSRPPVGGVPERGERLVRDPVCGTWVLPDRAVSAMEGGRRVFFCSTACRDNHRSRTA